MLQIYVNILLHTITIYYLVPKKIPSSLTLVAANITNVNLRNRVSLFPVLTKLVSSLVNQAAESTLVKRRLHNIVLVCKMFVESVDGAVLFAAVLAVFFHPRTGHGLEVICFVSS